jgi:hypothetical protein
MADRSIEFLDPTSYGFTLSDQAILVALPLYEAE